MQLRRRAWQRSIEDALRPNGLTSGEASELHGCLNFGAQKVFGRIGRAMLRPICHRQRQPSASELGTCLRNALIRASKRHPDHGTITGVFVFAFQGTLFPTPLSPHHLASWVSHRHLRIGTLIACTEADFENRTLTEKIVQNLCAGQSRQEPENMCRKCAGASKMCRNCAKFVRGCTCTILAEDRGGVSENVRAEVSRNFRYKFEFLSH